MSDATAVLAQLAPNARPAYRDAFAGGAALLGQFAITTPLRLAHFLAQVLHETGGGTLLRESLAYSPARMLAIFGEGRHSAAIRPAEVAGLAGNEAALAERVYGVGNPFKARELGNLQPGDGFRYRGAGVLQTTGRANFRRVGLKSGLDFEARPELVIDPTHALKPALHEWAEGRLNAAADRNDIRAITIRINGGTNGLADRQDWFARIFPLVDGGAAWEQADAQDETRWLQQALNDVGADPKLEVDGKSGPATEKAVRWFQLVAGQSVDGDAGPVTLAALREVLGRTRGGQA